MKKCPNCGHIFKAGETYCPNCDLFIPIEEQRDIIDHSENGNDNNTSSNVESSIQTFKHRNRIQNEDDKNTEDEPIYLDDDLVIVNEPIEPDEDDTTPTDYVVHEERVIDEEPIHNSPVQAVPEPKKPSNNRKVKVLTGIIVLLVVFGGGYIYNSQKKQNELEMTIKLTNSAETAISNLYMKNQDGVFLKIGISDSDIKSAEDKLKEIKGTDDYDRLNEKLKKATKTYTQLLAINDAFKTPVIEGNQLNSEAYVKDDTKLTIDPIEPEVNGFDIIYNEAIADATAQKEAIKTFNTTLEKLYKDNKVVNEPNKNVFNEAVKQLSKIKDPELKEKNQKIIDDIKKVIDEQEKKAAEEEAKRKEEEAKQAEAAKQNTTNNNNQQANNNGKSFTPSTNGGRWGTRQDANIDLSDPAWAWNPGVQEKVIAEVIRRGYVVDGGYTLVPKFIENGVGFYDLYATTNSKLFPNSKPSEFPIYVVTINDKTGWFKGNGPN